MRDITPCVDVHKQICLPFSAFLKCAFLDDGALSMLEFKTFFSDGILSSEDLEKLFNDIDTHNTA